jgi:hypothetical protein
MIPQHLFLVRWELVPSVTKQPLTSMVKPINKTLDMIKWRRMKRKSNDVLRFFLLSFP